MADSRRRRPASGSRPRVAGLRKRATQRNEPDRDSAAPAEEIETESAAETEVAEETEPGASDRSEASTGSEPTKAASVDDSAAPAEEIETESHGQSRGTDSDERDGQGSAGDSDEQAEDVESETQRLVLRDGVVEAIDAEPEAETSGDPAKAGTPADAGTPGDPGPVTESSASTDTGSSSAAAGTSADGSADGTVGAESERTLPYGVGLDGSGGEQSESQPRRRWLVPALAVATVVCVGLTFWFQSNVRAIQNDGPASNEALIDNAATSEVNGQVADAVSKLLSYDHANTAATERAAEKLLVGDAVKEHEQLFATVKKHAPQQKLVVTTDVDSSGVTYLQGDRARVLVFVTQNAKRDGQPVKPAPGQITVGAEKRGEQWKINKIIQR